MKLYMCGNNVTTALMTEVTYRRHQEQMARPEGERAPVYPVFTFVRAEYLSHMPYVTGSTELMDTLIRLSGATIEHVTFTVPFSNQAERQGSFDEFMYSTHLDQLLEAFGLVLMPAGVPLPRAA